MAFIRVNQADFYYELHGRGAPMVLISGYTCDHQDFAPLLKRLSQHFQVLVFDNRGIGQTRDQGEPLSVESMARDVMGLVQALKLTKPHIVGHSMGGTIAQSIAAQFPNAIAKLVLLATSAQWREAMLQGLGSLLELRKRKMDFDAIFSCTLPWIFDQDFLTDSDKIVALKQAILANPHPQSLLNQERQYHALKSWDGREALKAIQAPTLIAYGTQDLISLPQESQYLADNIANASIIEFNCAHAFCLTIPDALAQSLIDFCG